MVETPLMLVSSLSLFLYCVSTCTTRYSKAPLHHNTQHPTTQHHNTPTTCQQQQTTFEKRQYRSFLVLHALVKVERVPHIKANILHNVLRSHPVWNIPIYNNSCYVKTSKITTKRRTTPHFFCDVWIYGVVRA